MLHLRCLTGFWIHSCVHLSIIMKYKQADGWLHFTKWFSTNTRIEQEFITQTILKTRNWGILSPKLTVWLLVWKVFIEKRQRNDYIYKLSSEDKILSSLIKKAWCTCTFLNHFREVNEQLLCALFLYNRLCCYSFLYGTSLI